MSNSDSGNLYISLPQFLYSENFRLGFISLLFSTILVLSIITKFRDITIFVILLLTFIIMLIVKSSVSDNYTGSLPSTTYPNPPHLGLDGVSNNNRYL